MCFLAFLLFDFCQNENIPFLIWNFLTWIYRAVRVPWWCHPLNHPCSLDWPPLDCFCRVIKEGQAEKVTQVLGGGAIIRPSAVSVCEAEGSDLGSVSALERSRTATIKSSLWEARVPPQCCNLPSRCKLQEETLELHTYVVVLNSAFFSYSCYDFYIRLFV